MKWTNIKVLEHDIVRKKKVVIKAGTKNVKIAYRSAQWTFINEDGQEQRGNLYKYRGRIY
jgi:hypothetical protein